jgi:hypothetical protein
MTETSHQDLITELGREQIAHLAPQEMPLYRASSEAYFKDPDKALKGRQGKDEMLSFGSGEAVTFLTPIILAVLSEVVKYLVAEVTKSLRKESSTIVDERVKALFKKFRLKKGPPPLSPDQLKIVRQVAFDKARQLSLSEEQAGLMADSVVGGLAAASG